MAAPVSAAALVHVVGAGPGDPALLTGRGRELIDLADAIVYGPGVRRSILPSADAAGAGREIYYTGRRGGRRALSPDEVRQLVTQLARQGKRVVHLVPGDPFVFGRGSEAAQALHDAGIEYEIVPGVERALAAAAYAGIPLISGTMSAAVTVVHARRSRDVTDWTALAAARGTLVVHDALQALDAIVAGYQAASLPPDLPAAAVARAGRPDQRTVVATVGTIREELARVGLRGTITLVIGWTVLLRDELEWRERRPLAGRHVLVADGGSPEGATARIAELGATVHRLPDESIARMDTAGLHAAAAEVASYDWLVFDAPEAVDLFWEQLLVAGRDTRALAGVKVAAVGARTAATLLERGVTVDVVPERFTAEALIGALAAREDFAGTRVLYVGDATDDQELERSLAELGGRLTRVAAFRRVAGTTRQPGLRRALAAGRLDLTLLGDPGSARRFVRWAGEDPAREARIAVADAATGSAARALGLDVVVEGDGGGERLAQLVADYLTR